MKAVVAAFNQEKALIGAFSVITNLRMDLFEALSIMDDCRGLISLMAVFLSIAFLGQIFSIFSAFELRYRINAEHWPRGETDKNMKLYNTDSDVQHNWDVMQRDLRSDMCALFTF